ncbi:hypothetical protein [Haloferula sp.]|uniref:hypothetical protein n=1 Tax=Haloferula sp. TaxID=2497595 RepID=UPI0032A0649F
MSFRTSALGALLLSALIIPASAASLCFNPHQESDGRRKWAFELGVAFLTSNSIGELAGGNVNISDGPAGGEIYSLTAFRRLGQFELELWGRTYHPQLELPLTLEIVDENARSPFWDLNASVLIRWEEFPWNHIVKTTIATGLGLSYSENVYLMDIERHPGSDRSHLLFNWPIQLTLALPSYPDHQLSLFVSHQSGGKIFSNGGVNSLGFGYRYDF